MAYQNNDFKVTEWLNDTYPAIKKQAKHEGGKIHWADETEIKSLRIV